MAVARAVEAERAREIRGQGKGENFRFSISPLAPLPLICFMLLNNGPLFPCALIAALLHECAHIAAIYLSGARVVRLGIYPFGAEIVSGGRLLSYGQSLFVALSGVTVNFLCATVLLLPRAPYTLQVFGICSLGLGLFNLLPLKRLDGGEVVENLCALFLPLDRVPSYCRLFAFLGAAVLLLVCLFGIFFAHLNPLFLLLSLYLLWGVF